LNYVLRDQDIEAKPSELKVIAAYYHLNTVNLPTSRGDWSSNLSSIELVAKGNEFDDEHEEPELNWLTVAIY